jgi:hypothetical protein
LTTTVSIASSERTNEAILTLEGRLNSIDERGGRRKQRRPPVEDAQRMRGCGEQRFSGGSQLRIAGASSRDPAMPGWRRQFDCCAEDVERTTTDGHTGHYARPDA